MTVFCIFNSIITRNTLVFLNQSLKMLTSFPLTIFMKNTWSPLGENWSHDQCLLPRHFDLSQGSLPIFDGNIRWYSQNGAIVFRKIATVNRKKALREWISKYATVSSAISELITRQTNLNSKYYFIDRTKQDLIDLKIETNVKVKPIKRFLIGHPCPQ